MGDRERHFSLGWPQEGLTEQVTFEQRPDSCREEPRGYLRPVGGRGWASGQGNSQYWGRSGLGLSEEWPVVAGVAGAECARGRGREIARGLVGCNEGFSCE